MSSKQTSYHYIQIDAAVTIRHSNILLKVLDAELASAEAIARHRHFVALEVNGSFAHRHDEDANSLRTDTLFLFFDDVIVLTEEDITTAASSPNACLCSGGKPIMSRMEKGAVMGFFAIEPRHHAAILSLVAPATSSHRLLDLFAGEGEFCEAAAQAWNVTPCANELYEERAEKCVQRFGPKQALHCDAERLIASNSAFSALWCNPPYDHDRTASGNKRVKFRCLHYSWKWLQNGGLCFWVVYRQHITEQAATFIAKNSRSAEVWALPCKPSVRAQLLGSPFSDHVCSGKSKVFKNDIRKKLIELEAEKAKRYPTSDLVTMNKLLKQVID